MPELVQLLPSFCAYECVGLSSCPCFPSTGRLQGLLGRNVAGRLERLNGRIVAGRLQRLLGMIVEVGEDEFRNLRLPVDVDDVLVQGVQVW